MTTKLNEEAMTTELSGAGFFQKAHTNPRGTPPSAQDSQPASQEEILPPRAHATMPPLGDDELIETIRTTVKQLGKEEATYRLTTQEKKAVAGIVYAYTSSGTRITNNEVTRIGLAFLLADYRQRGAASVLARVLESLHS